MIDLALNFQLIKFTHLPVTRLSNWNKSMLPPKVSFINTTKNNLASVIGIWIPIEPEREELFMQKALLKHSGPVVLPWVIAFKTPEAKK